MMGVLLESRARKPRRSGGAALSVAVHLAIIGAVAAGTVEKTSAASAKTDPVIIHFAPPPPHTVVTQQAEAHSQPTPSLPPNIVIRHVDVPTITPVGIPPITASIGSLSDSIVLGGGGGPPGPRGPIGILDGEKSGSDQWNANEVLMHVLSPGKPRYPESLRSAGVDGRVLVQFTVDTTGRIDMSSVKILSSTHELFSRAVRDALGNFRFRPAEVGGRHVAALAQMPFDFQITR